MDQVKSAMQRKKKKTLPKTLEFQSTIFGNEV